MDALNRTYSLSEMIAVNKTVAVLQHAYQSLGLLPQVHVAGNNSHSFDSKSNVTWVGCNKNEPCFLHAHVLGRGDPKATIIGSVPLCGPEPGQLFNMREGKTHWEDGEMIIREALQRAICQVILNHAQQGDDTFDEFKGGDEYTSACLAKFGLGDKFVC